MELFNLENKVALVTGGGQGIGRGIVLCMAEAGADVIIIDLDEEKKAAKTKKRGVVPRTGLHEATRHPNHHRSQRVTQTKLPGEV